MDRRNVIGLSALTAIMLALLPGSAVAQEKTIKDQVIGIWTPVSIDHVAPDGKREQLYGANPKGVFIFDASGTFAQIQLPANRAKFKSGDRLKTMPEESEMLAHTSQARFGTWSVNEPEKTVILRQEGNLIPNSEGTDAKQIITSVTATELKITNPEAATGGGGKVEAVYRRTK